MKGYIYYIKNNDNNKRYIGSTIDLKRRIRQHLCTTRYNDYWHQMLHEFPENFEIGVLETVTADDLVKFNSLMAEKEIHYYNKFKSTTGVYNLVKPSASALRGTKYTDERTMKQREAHYGRQHKSFPNSSLINKFMKCINTVH